MVYVEEKRYAHEKISNNGSGLPWCVAVQQLKSELLRMPIL